MPVLDKLAGIFGGNIGDTVAKVASIFKVPPEQVEEHRFELDKLQAEMQSKLIDSAMAEVNAASANIQAEAKSGDAYTVRSRPTFLYVCYAVIIFNFIAVPIVQFFTHRPVGFINLPQELYWLFGAGYLGYTGASHWSDFMALPGKSEMNLPFGIKMGNDGGKNA